MVGALVTKAFGRARPHARASAHGISEFLRADGGDLALALRFARHASVATTVDVYGHLEIEELVRGMLKADERWK